MIRRMADDVCLAVSNKPVDWQATPHQQGEKDFRLAHGISWIEVKSGASDVRVSCFNLRASVVPDVTNAISTHYSDILHDPLSARILHWMHGIIWIIDSLVFHVPLLFVSAEF